MSNIETLKNEFNSLLDKVTKIDGLSAENIVNFFKSEVNELEKKNLPNLDKVRFFKNLVVFVTSLIEIVESKDPKIKEIANLVFYGVLNHETARLRLENNILYKDYFKTLDGEYEDDNTLKYSIFKPYISTCLFSGIDLLPALHSGFIFSEDN